jgi:hypothetical protein
MLEAHVHIEICAVSYMQHYKLQDADAGSEEETWDLTKAHGIE